MIHQLIRSCIVALLLAACQSQVAMVTITPVGFDPTPTREILVNNPHGNPMVWYTPINRNSDLNTSINYQDVRWSGRGGRMVRVPDQWSYVQRVYDTTTQRWIDDSPFNIDRLPPHVTLSDTGVDLDITKLSGQFGLSQNEINVYAGQRYVLTFGIETRLQYLDVDKSYDRRALYKTCVIQTKDQIVVLPKRDTPQTRRSWNTTLQEKAIYLLQSNNNDAITLSCYVAIPQAVFSGRINIQHIRLAPVDPFYEGKRLFVGDSNRIESNELLSIVQF